MKIKICGVTTVHDAKLVDDFGADYIGLNFHQASPRCLTIEQAIAIRSEITHAKVVGLFVEQSAADISEMVKRLNLDAVQLYPPASLQANHLDVERIVCLRDGDSCLRRNDGGFGSDGGFESDGGLVGDYYLIDTYHPNKLGGTGQCFDWQQLPADKHNIFVAGGITPENIMALAALKPYAADICSGVESAPGIKDPKKLQQLFERVTTC